MADLPKTSAEAAAQAAGYFFQLRFALFRALKRLMRDPTGSIGVEKIDDIVIQEGLTIAEITQLKHTSSAETKFNDYSPGIWRTIGNWSRLTKQTNSINLANVELVFITNAGIDDSAGISKLALAGEDRDPSGACRMLRSAALSSSNQSTKNDREDFLALDEVVQAALIRAIRVVPDVPSLAALATEIEDVVHYACEAAQLEDFRSELEGWWFDRIANVLSSGSGPVVDLIEIDARIGYLREKYKISSLQIDVGESVEHPDRLNDYTFVKQVLALNVAEQRLRNAQRDFLRASAQRSKWLRESRIDPIELDKYDLTLEERWLTQSAILLDELAASSSDDDKRKCGRAILGWAETQQTPLRGASAQFLTSGSYHTLADQLRVGWHPDFKNLFKQGSNSGDGSA